MKQVLITGYLVIAAFMICVAIHSYNNQQRYSTVLAAPEPFNETPERSESGMPLPTLKMSLHEGNRLTIEDLRELDKRVSRLEKKEMLRGGR